MGCPAGIKLSPIPADSIFAQMGLRTGDIIVGVNGESITRPEQAVRLLEKIKEGGNVSIQIKAGVATASSSWMSDDRIKTILSISTSTRKNSSAVFWGVAFFVLLVNKDTVVVKPHEWVQQFTSAVAQFGQQVN